MQTVLSAAGMRACDSYTIETAGIPSAVLMERAALACAEHVQAVIGAPEDEKIIVCLCGTGNNGGDGAACARILFCRGYDARIYLVGDRERLSQEMKRQMEIAAHIGVPETDGLPEETAVIVDALFGTGLSRAVTGEAAAAIEAVNASGAYVIAADIPSGIHADTGSILGAAVCADETVTMQFLKGGLLIRDGALHAGKVTAAEIGILPPSAANVTPLAKVFDEKSFAERFPKRVRGGNKGTYGKVLLVAGSKNMAGAAFLAGSAALKSGVGMVMIATCEANRQILQTLLPEAILVTWESMEERVAALRRGLAWCDVCAAGPGLGNTEETRSLVGLLLSEAAMPLILDADALNALHGDTALLAAHGGPLTVTPHILEMSRLTGKEAAGILADPPAAAKALAEEAGLTCILKDARTVTALPDGTLFINPNGNSGMATAGSGDVLTGITAALWARGADPAEAGPLAVYLHGAAGDAARNKLGASAMTARDLIAGIGDVLREVEEHG